MHVYYTTRRFALVVIFEFHRDTARMGVLDKSFADTARATSPGSRSEFCAAIILMKTFSCCFSVLAVVAVVVCRNGHKKGA